jgi:hypothetical protein
VAGGRTLWRPPGIQAALLRPDSADGSLSRAPPCEAGMFVAANDPLGAGTYRLQLAAGDVLLRGPSRIRGAALRSLAPHDVTCCYPETGLGRAASIALVGGHSLSTGIRNACRPPALFADWVVPPAAKLSVGFSGNGAACRTHFQGGTFALAAQRRSKSDPRCRSTRASHQARREDAEVARCGSARTRLRGPRGLSAGLAPGRRYLGVQAAWHSGRSGRGLVGRPLAREENSA